LLTVGYLTLALLSLLPKPGNSGSFFGIAHYSKLMNEVKLSPDLLKTKQHFAILDGLRGIAALAVVIFHFMEWVFPDPAKTLLGMVSWPWTFSFVYRVL
jgi:hypothetical protein